MSERRVLTKLERAGRRIGRRFKLRFLGIFAEPSRVRSRFGSCDSRKRIYIRLKHPGSNRFLTYPELVHTLCHEMAHLRHMNHGKYFKSLYRSIADWAQEVGLYTRNRRCTG